MRHVFAHAGLQAFEFGRLRDEIQRVRELQQPLIKPVRRKHQIVERFAVGVVVHAHAECAQPVGVLLAEPRISRRRQRRALEVVAKRRDHGPSSEAPAEMAVDDQAGAQRRVGVDVRGERRMHGNLAGSVMVEPDHARAGFQRAMKSVAIRVERHIEHRDLVAAAGTDTAKQPYVALDPGYQLRVSWKREPQLQQRADAVGVSIEDIIESHMRDDSRPGTDHSNGSHSIQ